MSAESAFISKVLETKDFETVDSLQIRSSYFVGRYKKAFMFIQNFKIKYGKVPSIAEFKKKNPTVDLDDPSSLEEPLAYYAEEVRSKVKHNTLVDALTEMEEKLNGFETDEAIALIVKTVMKIQKDYVKRETAYLNDKADTWKQKYEEAEKSGGLTGLLTGIAPFDRMTGGVGETDLVTFLGFSGVGKSFLLIIISCFLASMGYKVLFVTKEMGVNQIMKRVHACMTKLPYGAIKDGKLNPSQKEKYYKYLDKQEKEEESYLIIELATGGVTNISSLVDQHQPEVLMIDGGYLMTDDSDDNDWKGIYDTWWGFKQIALNRKIPTFTTMQLKSGKASADNVALAKHIIQHIDIMFGMEQDEQMMNDKEIKFKPFKMRDAEMGGSFVINWNFTTMDWSPIYSDVKMKPTEGEVNKKVQKLA